MEGFCRGGGAAGNGLENKKPSTVANVITNNLCPEQNPKTGVLRDQVM